MSKKISIYKAIKNNDIDKLNKLIKENVNLNISNHHGLTPLMLACKESNIEIITLLLENNVILDYKNVDQINALAYACKRGDLNIVKLLINNGAKIDEKLGYSGAGFHNYNLLYYAIDHIDIVKYLIENHKIINPNQLYENIYGCAKKNILHIHLNTIKEEVFQYLIKEDIGINLNYDHDDEKEYCGSNYRKTILNHILDMKDESKKEKYTKLILSTKRIDILGNKYTNRSYDEKIYFISTIFNYLYSRNYNRLSILIDIMDYIDNEIKEYDNKKSNEYIKICDFYECMKNKLLKISGENGRIEYIEYLRNKINMEKFEKYYEKEIKIKKIKPNILNIIYEINSNSKSASKR